MKLGILTNVVCNLPLEEALAYFKEMGIEVVAPRGRTTATRRSF